jgi:hypothetical protein
LTVDPRFNLLDDPNCLNAFHLVIPYLAKLNREERGRFTEFLLKIVMRSQKQAFAFRGFKLSEQTDEAYVVLASIWDRGERRIALANITMALGHKLNVKWVLGLAVGHDWPESQAFDLVFTDVSKVEADEDFLRGSEEVFGKLRVIDK